MGKIYTQESAKLGGVRDEDFGSVLLTFQRHLKLFIVEKDQWVSFFPFMLKGSALRFYEDKVEKKSILENILFHSLITMF